MKTHGNVISASVSMPFVSPVSAAAAASQAAASAMISHVPGIDAFVDGAPTQVPFVRLW